MIGFLLLVVAVNATPLPQDPNGDYEALIESVRKGDIASVRVLLERGVHPDIRPTDGRYPYDTAFSALIYGRNRPATDEAIATLLIQHGASMYYGLNGVLHTAAFAGSLGVFRACLKAGSDPNEMLVEQRPLYAALGRYQKHAHVKSRDVPSESRVPERPLMVKELIEAGADVHLPVKGNGSKALHIAAYYAFPQCVNILLDAGADLNEQTFDDGYTPLHCALLKENSQDLQTARILLDRGARLDLEDVYNRTVEQMVRQKRYTAAIELIEEYKNKRSPPRGA